MRLSSQLLAAHPLGTALRLALLLSLGTGLSECSPATPPSSPSGSSGSPELPSQFKNKCDAAKGQNQPLIVEWPAPERATLEAAAHHGQLVVHYEGCKLEVLRACTAPDAFAYKYTAITPKDELVTMKSADQLYASIPVYAASFEGKLAQKGELNASMTIVGMYESSSQAPALDELKGDCSNATHVVAALAIGAFEFYAGAAHHAGASAVLLGAGAGAEHDSSHETLSRDGDVKSCSASKRGDAEPPDKCGALLRLELVPIRPAGAGVPQCGPGTHLVDRQCKPFDKPAELAPEDASFADTEAGKGWGNRCYAHFKNGALSFARAACKKGLESNPDPSIRGAILFNLGLVDEATGDSKSACEWLRESIAVRPGIAAVQKKFDALECRKLLAN